MHSGLAQVGFSGHLKVPTASSTYHFSICAASLITKVSGGRIINARPEFETGWQGPLAFVSTAGSTSRAKHLRIDALPDSVIFGNPLATKGDSGLVHLFDIKPDGTGSVSIEGYVEVDYECTKISCDSESTDEFKEADWRKMMRCVAQVLVKKNGPAIIEMKASNSIDHEY